MALQWYHPKIHLGIARYASTHNWHLNTSMAFRNIPLRGWKGDAVLTQGTDNSSLNEYFQSLEAPLFFLNRYVRNDDQAIGELAAEYFMEKGFRHFAAFTYIRPQLHRRIVAYQQRLETAKKSCCLLEAGRSIDWLERQNQILKDVNELPKPVALFCVDDNMAAEVIDACQNHGILVPEEVAVMGVRNDPLICEVTAVPLSSIENQLEVIGYRAAELLDKWLDGEPLPEKPELIGNPKVITRRSTDIVAVEHPQVSRALKFIRNSFSENIGINDIVEATAMSERGLHHAFKEVVGRTIGKELSRIRMLHAEKLLVETDKILMAISSECGFQSVNGFLIAFKKQFGCTPDTLRKSNRK